MGKAGNVVHNFQAGRRFLLTEKRTKKNFECIVLRCRFVHMTKTIRISAWVHKEAKIAAAKDEKDLREFVDAAICALMKLRHHDFTPPQPSKSKKK